MTITLPDIFIIYKLTHWVDSELTHEHNHSTHFWIYKKGPIYGPYDVGWGGVKTMFGDSQCGCKTFKVSKAKAKFQFLD